MEGHVVRIEKIKYLYTKTLTGKHQRIKPLKIADVEHGTIFEGVCVSVCVCARVCTWSGRFKKFN